MVKVYVADILRVQDVQKIKELYDGLPGWRRQKVDRMKMPKDKLRSICAYRLLEIALMKEQICLASEEMAYGENGKPYLKNRADIHFSLSHSGERVMCVVSSGEVGCDVEMLKMPNLKVARRFFHTEEYEYLLSLITEEERKQAFFRFWTIKESVIKMTGQGMKMPLSDILIRLGDKESETKLTLSDKKVYAKEYDLQDGYRYACCAFENSFADEIGIIELYPADIGEKK